MSHETALKNDAREILTAGQILTSVIIETEVDERGNALTKHQNIKTFVRPRDHELEWGDTVCIKIVDVGPNHAEALALEKIE
jgi:hypothetical protein